MFIYLVYSPDFDGGSEDCNVDSVFLTREDAQKHIAEMHMRTWMKIEKMEVGEGACLCAK